MKIKIIIMVIVSSSFLYSMEDANNPLVSFTQNNDDGHFDLHGAKKFCPNTTLENTDCFLGINSNDPHLCLVFKSDIEPLQVKVKELEKRLETDAIVKSVTPTIIVLIAESLRLYQEENKNTIANLIKKVTENITAMQNQCNELEKKLQKSIDDKFEQITIESMNKIKEESSRVSAMQQSISALQGSLSDQQNRASGIENLEKENTILSKRIKDLSNTKVNNTTFGKSRHQLETKIEFLQKNIDSKLKFLETYFQGFSFKDNGHKDPVEEASDSNSTENNDSDDGEDEEES